LIHIPQRADQEGKNFVRGDHDYILVTLQKTQLKQSVPILDTLQKKKTLLVKIR
jgi:hypothetical protein